MPIAAIELYDRFFEIIAQNETTVLTKHRFTGTLGLWRLEWSDRGDYPPGFEADAWAAFLSTSKQ